MCPVIPSSCWVSVTSPNELIRSRMAAAVRCHKNDLKVFEEKRSNNYIRFGCIKLAFWVSNKKPVKEGEFRWVKFWESHQLVSRSMSNRPLSCVDQILTAPHKNDGKSRFFLNSIGQRNNCSVRVLFKNYR